MKTKVMTKCVMAAMLALVSLFQASTAHGFAAYSLPGYSFVDLGTNPDQFASWDPDTPGGSTTTLTYRFASSFTANSGIRNQVRLAFDQWTSPSLTADGANYSYLRNSGAQPFGDIRSIMVHEIGHALVYHHPDVAGSSNFVLNASPPPALVSQADLNTELMRSWVPPGAYNHILSHDELDGFEHFYGNRQFIFDELTSGAVNILISAGPMASGTWAAATPQGVQRNASDVTQGWRLTSAPINFNSISSTPMGYRTLAVNWDYQNLSAKDTSGFEIRTRGTGNTDTIWHFDGFGSASRPGKFYSFSTASANDDDNKGDLVHTWGNPHNLGVPGNIPAADVIHVGLELDVWDWTVVSAQVIHPDSTKSAAPLILSYDWNETVTGVASSPADGTGSGASGIDMGQPFRIVAQGIRIVNTQNTPSELVRVGVAKVDNMGLRLEDLNEDKLNELQENKLFELFDIPQITLDNGVDLFLVFDGDPSQAQNVIFLNRPDLVGHELFFYAQTTSGEMIIGNYALLGTLPITGVPEPATVGLLIVGGLGLLRRRRR